ncbi:ATP-binding protein [Cupriavidus plantarum]|uniref:ATP-binding protein n=1 Tax=Cupriavidus plantarum TaxID=942865 RepID=UPI0015C8C2F7|nr:winged helix-turn-helix domain-containing protein [Cupriavidus plantarum]NYH99687.1 putative ATPase/DNA-binding winged helix-turn-helix (wHTH) protein [Cupriavidus plantarum]
MSETYSFGPFQLYTQLRVLERGGAVIAMGSRAFDMLVAMVQRPGEVVSHRELMAFAWPELVVEESNVRVQMAKLRRILGCGRDGMQYIASVSGRGYCFVAPLRNLPAASTSIADTHLVDTHVVDPHVVHADIAERHGRPAWRRAAPAPLSPPIGRCGHLVELSRALQGARLLTIVGAGGAGKTTLAALLCHTLPALEGGTFFVDLSSVTTVAPLGEPLVNEILHTVASRRMLLVLDNCEHVAGDIAPLVERLLSSTTSLQVLATSREPLRVRGERLYPVPPLGMPPMTGPITAQQAMAFPAVQLFMDRAMEGGYDAPLGDDHAPAVAAICRRLDGNPLAIGLVACRAALYGIDGVAELLGTQLALSWRGRRDAPARHGTAEATLDWSCNLLAARDRRILHCLASFPGTFTIDAAVAAAAPEFGTFAVTQSIAGLIEKSLIAVQDIGGNTALRLLDTTRLYAATRL